MMKRFHVMVAVAVLLGSSTSAWAQQQRGRGAGFSEPGFLLTTQAVRNELKLTDEQTKKLENLWRDRPSLRDPSSREEWRQRLQEFSKKYNDTIRTVLDEQQQKRWDEIVIQRQGLRALGQKEIAAKLELDQAQKDKIRSIQRDNPRAENATPKERQKRLEKLNADLLAVLTLAQKEAFEKMQGEKFDFGVPRRNEDQSEQRSSN